MSSIDIDQLVTDMKSAASAVLKADVTTFRGFSERQLKAIAQQADLVATGIATGQITEETEQFFWTVLKIWPLALPRRFAVY